MTIEVLSGVILRLLTGITAGMRMVVKHLIETHGYKKIGFVGIDVENETHGGAFRDRYRAIMIQ